MVSMTINFSDQEMAVLADIATEQEMSKAAVLRQALRLYELVLHRMKNGQDFPLPVKDTTNDR